MTANVIDVADPADPRLDDFRDLNSVDRRPDLPRGKGLVIAEGVLVVQRMLVSRFRPRALLGTDRRLSEEAMAQRAAELAVMARRLKKTNEELDQFAYITSHDLRAPLRGIANLSRWIEEDMGDAFPPEARCAPDDVKAEIRAARLEQECRNKELLDAQRARGILEDYRRQRTELGEQQIAQQ